MATNHCSLSRLCRRPSPFIVATCQRRFAVPPPTSSPSPASAPSSFSPLPLSPTVSTRSTSSRRTSPPSTTPPQSFIAFPSTPFTRIDPTLTAPNQSKSSSPSSSPRSSPSSSTIPPLPSPSLAKTAFPRLRRWLGFSKKSKDELIAEQIRLAQHKFREAISSYASREAKTEDQELSCVVFDQTGHARSALYKKTVLCDQFDLDIRDIRRIDPSKLNRIPTVVIKNDAIILTVLHIRAIIKHNAVILFDPAGMSETTLQKAMLSHLKIALNSDQATMPFEFRAIESLFTSSCRALDAELRYVSVMVDKVLADLETDVSKDALRTLLSHTRRLTDFYDRANGVMTVLDDLLEDDGDMVALYLTDKFSATLRNPNRVSSGDHTEVELLLERLQKQVEEIVGEIGRMVENMRTTQDVVDLILDASRNRLLEMDLKVSMATLSVGSAALVAGFFGMNLQSHLETHPFAFYYAGFGALVMAGLIMQIQTRRLQSVLRKPLHESGNLVDTQYRWLDQGQPFQYHQPLGSAGGMGGAGGLSGNGIGGGISGGVSGGGSRRVVNVPSRQMGVRGEGRGGAGGGGARHGHGHGYAGGRR